MNKNNKKLILPGLLGAGALFFISNVVGMILMANKSNKKLQNNGDGNNMMYSVALGKKALIVKPDTDYAYINCINGVVTLTLNSLPQHYDMYIELASVCARINLKLPAEINVLVNGKGHFESVKNRLPVNTEEWMPTVHINMDNTLFTQINITEGADIWNIK